MPPYVIPRTYIYVYIYFTRPSEDAATPLVEMKRHRRSNRENSPPLQFDEAISHY